MAMKNYDIFISYKHSAVDGNLTQDHHIAKELHDELEKQGFIVFFSDDTIQELGESKYQEAIDHALDTAKFLIVIATKETYINSNWVKYEWSSFCGDILSGQKKKAQVVTCTSNISTFSLPRSLRNYQNFDLTKIPISRIVDFVVQSFKNQINSQNVATESMPTIERKTTFSSFNSSSKSAYTANLESEYKRLSVQSLNTLDADKQSINYALSIMSKKEGLTVLDVGCAYGFVTASRFNHLSGVKQVIGIDISQEVINKAKELHCNEDKMQFYCMNVEDENFEENLKTLLLELDIKKVDIIFSSLVLHHLKNPNKVLRILKKFIAPSGTIILRGSDDGSKLCHPYEDLMKSIIERTVAAKNVSDRQNGRKLYTQIFNAGFSNIRIFSYMSDTSTMDQEGREKLFNESFSYRINYYKRMLEANPNDYVAKEGFNWMKEALEQFECHFYEKNFWYCEYAYVGVAQVL